MAYNWFRIDRDNIGSILDTNGEPLYLDEYNGLLREIIERNDVPTLKCYIRQIAGNVPQRDGTIQDDPLWVAAAYGSIDALRVLLDLYETDSAQNQVLGVDTRGFWMLDTACEYGQLETARFLLDRDYPLGAAYTERPNGELALLSAGSSLVQAGSYEFTKRNRHQHDNNSCLQDRVARSEELIRLLLDRGASPENAVQTLYLALHEKRANIIPPPEQHRIQRLLGQIVSRGSYELVSRLIIDSAEIHKRQELRYNQTVQHVTPLHIASGFWNIPAIQALFDHSDRSGVGFSEMVSVSDHDGRLPLHWAAHGAEIGGEMSDEQFISEEDLCARTIGTLKLLIENNPDTVNYRDSQSMTALHHFVNGHSVCSSKLHFEEIIRFLCETGLDASSYNIWGCTTLHELAKTWNPVSPDVLQILLMHGAKTTINHIDSLGKTALHRMAKNLRQVEAVRVLLSHGADKNVLTSEGNSPLHEAAMGVLRASIVWEKDTKTEHVYPSMADKVKVQDEMVMVLQEAGCSMDQRNREGKTPQQLLEETRANWHRIEESKGKPLIRGRGRR
ncbi:uncharacterized protein BHQ10_009611 [Talaromyces amestolkiae]|uniref:Uncharacterized protein n=1 Tax=Talaromyces amestolkiae TaxID=1196081 RepID=A0A364LCU7_TALAM|nr:uncharacterized protein BHQ10_009611 [Talaromyces amestolkiae]RAO73599.1 hypothetical protein BHQ10_009611 [Talaromyces amestolkiae]